MTQLLLISSTAALALLIVHSWRTRGRRITLIFFGAGILYGLLRENAIWLLMRTLTGVPDLKPYIPEGGALPEIGHANLQVAVGWVFAMYLAWTISELILRRIPALFGRVFVVAGLSSLFILALCWCMETTAVAVGWWYWMLPTRSALFGNVTPLAMEGWFSVVPDFLLPFLVIVCSASTSRWRWLWALVFPLHILGHMTYKWFDYAPLLYNVLELVVVAPMMFSRLGMARGAMSPDPDPVARVLPAAALAIFFLVVTAANLSSDGAAARLMTEVPLLLMCLFAWGRLSIWAALGLSVACVAGGALDGVGARALYVLAPAGAFFCLRYFAQAGEPAWLKPVPSAAVAVLAAVALVVSRADAARVRAYVDAWVEGDRIELSTDPADAAGDGMLRPGELRPRAEAAYRKADALRPNDVTALESAVLAMMSVSGDARETMPFLQYRMVRVARELEEVVRRDPGWLPPRRHLVHVYLLEGRLSEATRHQREIARLRSRDMRVQAMLGYLLLREGELDEAEKVLVPVAQSRRPPVEALVDLGVIRFRRERDEEAKRLWERALEIDPSNAAARANIDRLRPDASDRSINARYLAREVLGAGPAAMAVSLAQFGADLSAGRRVDLLVEATQFDPSCLAAHLDLAAVELDAGEFHNPGWALLHARRADELTQSGDARSWRPQALLLLGRALEANGKRDEARKAFNEGRALSSGDMVREFDRALSAP